MKKPSTVSIITINYRQAALTCDLLDTLRTVSYSHYELLLVDNGQLTDESALFHAHYPQAKIISSKENLGFAGANNLAIQQATGDYILLLNNDTLVPENFLEPLVQVLDENPQVGIVSPKIYYYDSPNTLQYVGTGHLDLVSGRGHNLSKGEEDDGSWDQMRETQLAHGACMLIRREVLEEVGLLSEDYFLYYEELDYCLRAGAAGWKIYFTPHSYITHRESSSVGKFSALKTYYMFRNRWLLVYRFGPAGTYWRFILYFLLLTIPTNLLRFVLRRDWEHVRALGRGLVWNIKRGHLWRSTNPPAHA